MAYDAAKLQQKLKQGEPIRFDTAAPRHERVIDPDWLVALANAGGVIAQPVDIRNAVFPKPVGMRFRVFDREVFLHDCTFEDEVDFNGSQFAQEVELTGSTFAKTVNFTRVRARMLRLTRCHFAAELTAFDLSVEESLHAPGAEFGDAVFERLSVGKVAFFRPAFFNGAVRRTRFRGKANFNNASIRLEAEFEGTLFEQDATFRRSRIEGNALFGVATEAMVPGGNVKMPVPLRTVFERTVNFRGALISGDLVASGIRHDGEATYAAMTVEGRALFTPYFGEGDVRPATFGDHVTFDHAVFRQGAEFRGASFEKNATFAFALFEGDCDFSSWITRRGDPDWPAARCGGVFDFRRCTVTGDARFPAMSFAGDALFDQTRVTGKAIFSAGSPRTPVEFRSLAAFRDFEAAAVVFDRARLRQAIFNGMEVRGLANFNAAHFETAVQFAGAKFGGRVLFVQARFDGAADFSSCEAKAAIHFGRAEFVRSVSFADASFDLIGLTTNRGHHATFGAGARVDCTGMTFRRIFADYETLLPRTDPYERQLYIATTRYLRGIGETERAAKVYHARRRREMKASWRDTAAILRHSKLRRPVDLFWSAVHAAIDSLEQILSFVGVSPLRMAAIAAGVLVLGGIIFAQRDAVMLKDAVPDKVPAVSAPAATVQRAPVIRAGVMGRQSLLPPVPVRIAPTPCGHCRQLSVARAFGFSVRMFMPVGDLPVATRYVPSEQPTLLGFITYDGFAAIERAFGLLFVPLAIAAFTSVLLGGDK